ncbi:MAG: hypothetical protein QUS14_08635 [Pyrinomonadaceae bacterium]|nr:hypothetical protein [Pyrinomonadaceae bacterium]
MKIRLALAAAFAAIAVFAPATFAQKEKSRSDLYKEIVKLTQSKKAEDKDKAYVLGKEYVTRFGSEENDDLKKVKEYVGKYRNFLFFDSIEKSKWQEGYSAGREILQAEPENANVLMNMVYAGYRDTASYSNAAFAEEMAGYSRRAAALLEAGKVTNFDPFTDRNSALGYVIFFEGHFTAPKDKKAAAAIFYKATQIDGPIKTTAVAYSGLADYYETTYEKFSADVNARRNTMSDAEYTAAMAKNDQIIDAMLDAYARAVKYGEAEKMPQAAGWRQRFEQVYQYRKKSTAGIAEYVAGIEKTPLPDPGKL